VLATVSGVESAALVGALALAMGALIALSRGRGARLRWAGVLAPAALAFLAPTFLPAEPAKVPAVVEERWQPFEESRIPALVAEGRTVLVHVSADWCITCRVNKALVLDRGAVASRLGESGVVAMIADWTRPDEGIAAYLARFGRYGIPFDAVYGPGAPDGIVLPELLTEGVVLEALAAARGAGAIAAE
ncbi:MAG: thioredoxin family protein, partial [Alphaproteobacteria bacterium]